MAPVGRVGCGKGMPYFKEGESIYEIRKKMRYRFRKQKHHF